MLNSEHKRNIDALRDLLVGKIPNPQGQVQQITLALIYKFMSDIDNEQAGIFEHASFFDGNFAKYKWQEIMNPRLGAQERLNIYAEGIEKMHENPKVPQLFRNIFKHAFLPFRDPGILDRFLKQINEFHYEHSEDLGDAFEYLLSCLASAGDAGMFRTPRHIIDFIVSVVDPQFGETILDPACGTAGFLVSAFKHIVAKNPQAKNKIAELSPKFVGYDISPDMVQLALVNLYLHQFPDPKIHEYDTLTYEDKRGEKFDVVLANPPFMSPKGGIQPHNRFSVKSNRSEVLFVDYMMDHLKSTGKAGIIVPEGIIFQSGKAYKQLRKKMIEEDHLWAVVSLPSGVFQPYAGVKTSILLFDKAIGGKTEKILFVKVNNDGYDLGAQRRPIDKNDLPKVFEILISYKDAIKNDKVPNIEGEDMLLIDESKVAETGDYNLSMETYRKTININSDYPMVELGELCEFQNGYAFESSKYVDSGYQVMRITNVQKGFIDGKDPKYYPTDEVEELLQSFILKENDLLISLTGNVGRVGFLKHGHLPAVLNQRVAKIEPNEKRINRKYLFHIMNTGRFEEDCIGMSGGVAQKNLGTTALKNYKIPLPPLPIQEQIVAELDGYQKEIEQKKEEIIGFEKMIQKKIAKVWGEKE